MPTTDELINRLVDIRGDKGPEVLADSVREILAVVEDDESTQNLVCALVEQLNDARHGIRVGTPAQFERYRRDDGTFAWRLFVGSDIVATDSGQGYENGSEADRIGHKVVTGAYVVHDVRTGTVLGETPDPEDAEDTPES